MIGIVLYLLTYAVLLCIGGLLAMCVKKGGVEG
jgi:hypothetical protein